MKKKLLITGSGGFVLGNLIRHFFFNRKQYTISSIDKVREEHIIHNIYVNLGHAFHIADVCDLHILNVILQKEQPDIVIHGAAETGVDNSQNCVQPFIHNNILGTQNVIDVCVKNNAKLIYISTDQVYGSHLSEKEPLFTEESGLNPQNPYSITKYSSELLIKSAAKLKGLKYNILRLSSNYGPWQTGNKFIPKIIKSVLDNKKIEIYGKGSQVRDWTHVTDTCEAICKVIDNWKDNEIYNVSANQEFTNLEVFQIVCNALEKGHDLISFVEDRPYHEYRYGISAEKLNKLGWKKEIKFKDGIQQTAQWYLNNAFVLRL
jgi:dTDP-glucose 4,6-dehydratase